MRWRQAATEPSVGALCDIALRRASPCPTRLFCALPLTYTCVLLKKHGIADFHERKFGPRSTSNLRSMFRMRVSISTVRTLPTTESGL